jgi:hypothetical protein
VDQLNPYVFARANPIRLVDRNGKGSEKAEGIKAEFKKVSDELASLQRAETSAHEKVVEAEAKVRAHEYKLSELESEEVKGGLQGGPRYERKLAQIKHNLEQAKQNLRTANDQLKSLMSKLESAYKRSDLLQKKAVEAGVDPFEVLEIQKNAEDKVLSEAVKKEAQKNLPIKKGGGGGGTPQPPPAPPPPSAPPAAGGGPGGASAESHVTSESSNLVSKGEQKLVTTEEKVAVKAEEKFGSKVLGKIGKLIPFVGIGLGAHFVKKDIENKEYGSAVLDAAEAIPDVGDIVFVGEVLVRANWLRAQQEVANEKWHREQGLPPPREVPF